MVLAYINDQFIPEKDARIGVADLAIRRGFGIFDFFRTVGLKPLFIDDHIERLHKAAEKVGLPLDYTQQELKGIGLQLIHKNKINNGGIRMVLTGGYSANGYTPSGSNLIITNEPVKLVTEEVRQEGIKIITHDYQREFPEVKTINYFTGIMMQKKAIEEGAFDILYHDNGQVREFTRSNIFIVNKKDEILTPSIKILKGVTRKHVLELANKHYTVKEYDFTMNDLFEAKEVFMTGTTKKVLPIIQIDKRIVGSGVPGDISLHLAAEFNKLESALT